MVHVREQRQSDESVRIKKLKKIKKQEVFCLMAIKHLTHCRKDLNEKKGKGKSLMNLKKYTSTTAYKGNFLPVVAAVLAVDNFHILDKLHMHTH